MLNTMGERQKQLLKLLRANKLGLSVDELSKGLEITRNAVRQHLSSLEAAGLVTTGTTRPSGGGRPQQLYILTELGSEASHANTPGLHSLWWLFRPAGRKGEHGKRLNDIGRRAQQLAASIQTLIRTRRRSISLPR